MAKKQKVDDGKKFYQKRRFYILVALLVIGGIGNLFGIGDKKSDTKPKTEQSDSVDLKKLSKEVAKESKEKEQSKANSSSQEQSSTTVSSTTQSTQEQTLNDAQQNAVNNVGNFNQFVEAYKAIPASERTPVWSNNLRGTKVTWSGNIIEVGSTQIYVIDSSKYQQGMTWDNVAGTENEYYVFVAKFPDRILRSAFSVGSLETFTGTLESRGNDSGFISHWKLYNVRRGQ